MSNGASCVKVKVPRTGYTAPTSCILFSRLALDVVGGCSANALNLRVYLHPCCFRSESSSSIPGWLDFSLPSNLCSDVAFSGRSTLDTGLKTATSRVPLPCCVFYSTSVQSLSRVRLSATPWDCSTPGFPVHHQLPELTQTKVYRVGDAIQPSHPLSSH